MEVGNGKIALRALVCLAAATGIFALGYYTDAGILALLSLLTPFVFIYLRAATGVWPAVTASAAFCALAYIMAGYQYMLTAAAVSLPIGFVMGYVVKRKLSFYYSALISCASVLATLFILLLALHLLFGASADSIILSRVESELAANPFMAKVYYYIISLAQSGAADYTVEGISSALNVAADVAVKGVMSSVRDFINLYLPQICASLVALLGILYYIVPRAIVRKTGGGVGPVPEFNQWNLPRRFGTWSLVLLLISFIGVMAEWNNFELVYSIVMGFLNVTYSIQGMAFVDWLLKKRMQSTAARAAIIAVTFLLLSMVNLYMWIGIFEQFAKFRKREAV